LGGVDLSIVYIQSAVVVVVVVVVVVCGAAFPQGIRAKSEKPSSKSR